MGFCFVSGQEDKVTAMKPTTTHTTLAVSLASLLMLRLVLLWFVVVGLASCQKLDTPPCVPQKPTGTVGTFATYQRFMENVSPFYLSCDTCGSSVVFKVSATNYKSVETIVGLDPRVWKTPEFRLVFPEHPAAYRIKTTLKNWGDCGSTDTLVTVIESRFQVAPQSSMKRWHGTAWLGEYNDGRRDTVFIDTITNALLVAPQRYAFNNLGKFPLGKCGPFVSGYYTGTQIVKAGNILYFENSGGGFGICNSYRGVGKIVDSLIELYADTLPAGSVREAGFVYFKGRRIR